MSTADHLVLVLPALVAGALVLATHVPLGMQVLRRGIVFIDLAIAQIAALGVLLAGYGLAEPAAWQIQLCALGSALAGSGLLAWMEKRWPDVHEAQIGAVFVLAASGGILLLAGNPHGGEHLQELLTGQILWVSLPQLVLPAILSVLLCGLIGFYRARLPQWLFYPAFAVAITVSVQLVGVYLVFASLIMPALATRHTDGPIRLILAYAVGLAGYLGGLLLSLWLDLPAGALIVWLIAASSLLARIRH